MTLEALRPPLRAILQAVPGLVAVAWENRHAEREAGVPYLREQLQPVSARKTSFGRDTGYVTEYALYKLDLFWPAGGGTAEPGALAEAIRSAFKPGTGIGPGGVVVWADRGPPLPEDHWVMFPVSIRLEYHRVNQ